MQQRSDTGKAAFLPSAQDAGKQATHRWRGCRYGHDCYGIVRLRQRSTDCDRNNGDVLNNLHGKRQFHFESLYGRTSFWPT